MRAHVCGGACEQLLVSVGVHVVVVPCYWWPALCLSGDTLCTSPDVGFITCSDVQAPNLPHTSDRTSLVIRCHGAPPSKH